ncbi:hypothetical protein Tco_1074356 [Tanacetum coccineum]
MIFYRIEEVKNKCDGPMSFAMLLTRLYNHILQTNPQAIVLLAWFPFHERVMNPLDILRNPTKDKGKRVASPLASPSSSSSFDDNEAPSFLEFYKELPDDEDLTNAQREKRGMFKCLNRYFGTITKNKGSMDPPYGRSVPCLSRSVDHQFITMTSSSKTSSPNFKRKTARMSVKYPTYVNLTSSSEEHPNEKTPSPPPRKKSLSPPQAPSKSISSKSTHYTSSSSPSKSPTPTYVAPPPKLRFCHPTKT